MQIFNQSFLSSLDTHEQQNFTEAANSTVPTMNKHQPLENGALLFEIKSNSSALNQLIQRNWCVADYAEPYTYTTVNGYGNETESEIDPSEGYKTYYSGNGYLNDLSKTIIKPQNKMTLLEVIQTSYELANSDSNFAGVLLKDGKHLINPLHPLVALGVLDSIPLDKTFTVMFYFYSNKKQLLELTSSRNEIVDPNKIEQNLNYIIQLYSSKIDQRRVKVVSRDQLSNSIHLKYKLEKEATELQDTEFFIVTNQVLTKGIFVPYYGTSAIRRQDGVIRGINLSPHLSANISDPERHYLNSPQTATNICTGQTSQRSREGWKTLSHSNLSSPLNHYCLLSGAVEYADACIRKSLELYKLANLIKEPSNGKAHVHYQIDDLTGETYPA